MRAQRALESLAPTDSSRFGANVQPDQIVADHVRAGKEPNWPERSRRPRTARRQVRRPAGVRPPPQARASAARRSGDARLRPALVRGADACLGEHALRGCRSRARSRPHIMEGIDPTLLGGHAPPASRVDRGRQRAHDQLDDRRRARPRAGPSSSTRTSTRRRRSSGCGRRSRTSAGSTRRIRWRRGSATRPADEVAEQARRARARRASLRGPRNRSDGRAAPGQPLDGARLTTVDGIVHLPNIPTEEVFTTPDPERVDGVVTLDQAAVHLRRARSPGCGCGSKAAGRSRSTPTRAPTRSGADRARCRGRAARRGRAGRPREPDRAARDGLLRHPAGRERRQPHRARRRAYEFAVEGERGRRARSTAARSTSTS